KLKSHPQKAGSTHEALWDSLHSAHFRGPRCRSGRAGTTRNPLSRRLQTCSITPSMKPINDEGAASGFRPEARCGCGCVSNRGAGGVGMCIPDRRGLFIDTDSDSDFDPVLLLVLLLVLASPHPNTPSAISA